jgi:hypothetical protein
MFKEILCEKRGHDFVTEEFLNFPRLHSAEKHESNTGYKRVWVHYFVHDLAWSLSTTRRNTSRSGCIARCRERTDC